MIRWLLGQSVANSIYHSIHNDLKHLLPRLTLKNSFGPKLAIIKTTSRPDSALYISNKQRALQRLGMDSEIIEANTDAEISQTIRTCNQRPEINGILVQLPVDLNRVCHLQNHLDTIDPDKDVDCIGSFNMARLLHKPHDLLAPCTPRAIMTLLSHYAIPISGKSMTIIGRSQIVGLPLSLLMLHSDATVSICHSKTNKLEYYCQGADIVVAAVGKTGVVKRSWCKPGATLIDVGINRAKDGEIQGDIENDTDDLSDYNQTPVPGGIGPITVAMLCRNLLDLAIKQHFKTEKL